METTRGVIIIESWDDGQSLKLTEELATRRVREDKFKEVEWTNEKLYRSRRSIFWKKWVAKPDTNSE